MLGVTRPRQVKLRRGAPFSRPRRGRITPGIALILHRANYRGLVLVGVVEFWNHKTRTDYPQARWLRLPAHSVAASAAEEDDERDEIDRALAVA